MSFVIAGVVLLLSFIVGVASYLSTPLFEKVNSDNEVKDDKIIPAITLSTFFTKSNWKSMLFICCVSLLCSFAAGLSYHSGTGVLDLCRQVAVALVLLAAMVIDSKTCLIPNVLILSSLGMGSLILGLEFVFVREDFFGSLIMSLSGLICCVVLFYVLSVLTKDGLGMGDVKLISGIGFLLGFAVTLMLVLCSLILCVLVSIVLVFGKKKNKNDKIPFGPFLFFGYIVMFLFLSV